MVTTAGSNKDHFAGLILLMIFVFAPDICSAAKYNNIEFIKTSCKATRYPQVCFETLSVYASTISSSKQLAHAALSVSLSKANSTSAMMRSLAKVPGLKHREVAAMKDCVDTIADSVYELQRSMKEMGHLYGPEMKFMMSNIQTWVSAALTDEDTCMEGFAGKVMEGSLKLKVRSNILKVVQLTSNALALINRFASSIQVNSP